MLLPIFRVRQVVMLLSLAAVAVSDVRAEEKLPAEILGPDGKPVAAATIHRVWRNRSDAQDAWDCDSMDLADWKRGTGFDTREGQRDLEYIVIESPGCALGIYPYYPEILRLQKEFWVEGKVCDEAGVPMLGVELTIGKFGLHTYTHILMHPLIGKLPWVRTTSDQDGRYRFKGAVLMEYGWDMGVEVTARGIQDSRPMVGASGISFLSDSPLFEEGRKSRRFQGGENIVLAPCDEISGVVVDSITGKPIAGAVLKAEGQVHDLDDYDGKGFITDENGRFAISRIRLQRLGIEAAGHAPGNLQPIDDWRAKRLVQLEVRMVPLVETTLRFIDTHSGKPPLVPLVFSHELESPAGDGWILEVHDEDDCGKVFTVEEEEVGADGVFSGLLPVGDFEFTCRMERCGHEVGPYTKSFHLKIPLAGDRDFKIELQRNPGLLFSLRTPEDFHLLSGKEPWATLRGELQPGDKTFGHGVDLHESFVFEPLGAWGQKMNFKLTCSKDQVERTLMDRGFAGDADTWPVTLDVAAALKPLGRPEPTSSR